MVDNPQAKRGPADAARGQRLDALLARLADDDDAGLLRAAYAHRSAAGEEGLDDALEVAAVLAALELDADCQTAALLWTPPRPAALASVEQAAPAEQFGAAVSALVGGAERMADITGWMDLDRHSRAVHGEGLRRLLLAMVEDPRVVLMALAERLQRLRDARSLSAPERARLAIAAREAWAPLASRLGVWQLKWELEDLAFRELQPEVYHQLAKRLQERRVVREEYIAEVVATLSERLREAGISAEVYGRPKHLYSIWRKMQLKHLEFERVYDVRAVRVLVDTLADCYAALGIVHGIWPHIRGEFDDYITAPKGNMYQSLHTAVIGPGGRTLEVQIRTHEMHQRAEHGVAAHWRYKERRSAASERDVDQKIAWLRQVLEWKDVLEDPGAESHAEGAPEGAARVYVVTPKGEVIDLETGATPLDFAYHVHTDVGHRCRGAKVDGVIVPLTYRLRSGERVEVLTGKTPAPSRDWLSPHLGYLRTSRARAKVRAWFRQQDHAQNVVAGRELYERELKRLGLPRTDPHTLVARFNLHDGDDLLAALGRGDISSGQLASALAPLLESTAEEAPRSTRGRRTGDGSGGVTVAGVGDLLTQVAGCCKPVPPDDIVGYVTRGRGVSIHRRDCRNVLALRGEERARLLEVSWSGAGERVYPVAVHVAAYDRPGLLRDVTTLLANERINVVSVDMHTDRNRQMALMDLIVEVREVVQLSRMLERIGQLPNVVEARRRG